MMYSEFKRDGLVVIVIGVLASPFVAFLTLPVLGYCAGRDFGYERGLDHNFDWKSVVMQIVLIIVCWFCFFIRWCWFCDIIFVLCWVFDW